MTRSCVEACMVVSADSEPYEQHGLGAVETIDKASTGLFRVLASSLHQEYPSIALSRISENPIITL